MSGEHTPAEKLDVTLRFEKLSDLIWDEVAKWPSFAQNTVGQQLVRSSDSVAANIIEGGYREGDPDALRFFGIARGSAAETAFWIRRSLQRGLLDEGKGRQLLDECTAASFMLGKLIAYRRNTRWKVRESE